MTRMTLTMLAICLLPLTDLGAEEPFGSEQLLFVEPESWVQLYADREGNLSTTEYVPKGQTEDDWKEMLSVQIAVDTPDADPNEMLTRAALFLAKSCPDYRLQPIELGGVGDYPTLALMLMCGKNSESGRGEFTILRAIAGKQNFYLLQKIWRGTPYKASDDPPVSLDERKLWLGYLAFQTVCDQAAGTCPANVAE